MGVVQIVIICLLAVFISALLFFIIRNMVLPKRIEAVPKLIKQGKTQAAIKVAKQIVTRDSKDYTAHYYLGKAYLADNKPELAVIEYKTVNEHAIFGEGINEVDFRKEYAQLLVKYNQQNEALKNFLLLTKLDPRNGDNFYNVGHIYEQQNRYDMALGFMQKAVVLDKKNAKAHASIGLIMYRAKQPAEAKREISLSLKLSPDTYSSYYYLGKILKDGKDIPGAIKAFEKAQRDPEFKQKAIIERGSCFMMVNRLDNAVPDFQRAIELDRNSLKPETLYARYFLAACYEKTRNIDKAIEQWEQIYKRNKTFRDVGVKLSEYKDLQANDYLKDYLTSNDEEFAAICRNVLQKAGQIEILSCDTKKWGCQITGVEKSDDSWMSVRKQVLFIRFYREPEPIEDAAVRDSLEQMKTLNSVKGFLYSSSGFTNAARRFSENRPVELIDKDRLESMLTAAGAK